MATSNNFKWWRGLSEGEIYIGKLKEINLSIKFKKYYFME